MVIKRVGQVRKNTVNNTVNIFELQIKNISLVL